MPNIVACIVDDHSPLMVAIAAAICLLGCVCVVALVSRQAAPRLRWARDLFAIVVASYTVWATHFVAMIGYRVPSAVGYDLAMTALSGALMVVFCAGAFWLAHHRDLARLSYLPGAVFGAGVAAMHYAGVAGMRMPLGVEWHMPAVAVSVGIAVVLGSIGFRLAFLRGAGWTVKAIAAAALILAITGLHFVGVSAMTLYELRQSDMTVLAVQTDTLALIIGMLFVLMLAIAYSVISPVRPRQLWRRSVVAVLLVLTFIAIPTVATLKEHAAMREQSTAINMSGRQRMLSQRIALYAVEMMQHQRAAPEFAAELTAAVDLFERSHVALVGAADVAPLVPLTDDLRAIYFGEPAEKSLDTLSRAFISRARLVLDGTDDEAAAAEQWLLFEARREIFELLDSATNAFEAQANVSNARLHAIEAVSLAFAIVTVLSQVILVFMPSHRSIVNAMNGHERAQSKLRRALAMSRAARREADVARSEAEAASQAKSLFLANMSHEIRTPMNGVLGMAYALQQTPLNDDQRRKLDVINNSGETLMEVINDILDISKIEANKLKIESTVFTVQDIMDSVSALYQMKANEKGLKFRFADCDDGDREYVGDPTRIQQILSNLVSNAIKFTDDGAILATVMARPADEGRRTLLRFTVADSGPGIAPDAIERLFSNFTQADDSITRKHGGTGLGLAICKQLCELMGGDISVESVPGQGSVFRFNVLVDNRIDNVAPRPAEASGAGVEPGESHGPARILVAEDNPQNQLVLQALLEPCDAEITITENGREAVEAWKASAFDVVFMDIQMPEMSGVEACLEIRRMERELGRPRIPIVALTANAMSHQVKEYLDAGMDAHIAKPAKPHELFRTLRSVFAGEFEPGSAAAA